MAALGTFTLRIDGSRLGGAPETAATLHLTIQGQDAIRDDDADLYWFPPTPPAGLGISLPYDIALPTDVDAGESETIGYRVLVKTALGGRVEVVFAAQAADTTVNLDDLPPTATLPFTLGGGLLYVEDGALKYRGTSGTVTTLADA